MFNAVTTVDPSNTGGKAISDALGGELCPGSLVIIEGEPTSGKSVLSQHLAHGSLTSGKSVVYYTTDIDYTKQVKQTNSPYTQCLLHHQATDRLRIHLLAPPLAVRDVNRAVELLINHMSELPLRFKLIIVDCLTPFMNRMNQKDKIEVLRAFKEMDRKDRSIVLVTDTHIFENDTLSRTYLMSDYYLRLRSQDTIICQGLMDARKIKSLEICKLRGAEQNNLEKIEFEIRPEAGIQILPFVKLKV